MGERVVDGERAPVDRATRYQMQLTVFYRSRGDRRWREGRTDNISRSGVLFRTDRDVPLQTPIEMLLALPVEVGGGHSATVICRGRVVRLESAPDTDSPAVVAATIAGYRLTRTPVIDPTRVRPS
jgi:hypothetical protein